MRESMLSEPVYTDVNSIVTLTLRNKVTDHRDTIHADTIEQIEQHWKSLSENQRAMLSYLLQEKESTISQFVETIGITDQAVRHNLKKLEKLDIIERISEKRRDPNALYRFKNK
jgi:ATP-dependent DNA helicase RecG